MKKTKLALFLLVACMACSKQKSDSPISSLEELKGRVEFECVVDNSAAVETKGIDDNIWNDLEVVDGKIKLPSEIIPDVDDFSLLIEGEYIIPDKDLGIQVEGGATESYTLSNLSLKEYNSDIPYLFGGEYTLYLSYGDPTEEGYNKPSFSGETDFTIYGRKSDKKSVSVELSNSIIRGIETTEYFNKYYTSAEFTVTTSAGTSISLESGVKTLFFVEAGTTLNLSGKATKTNGYEVTFSGSIGSTSADSCYTIVVDAEDAGGKAINVTFNDDISSFDVVNIGSEINPDAK